MGLGLCFPVGDWKLVESTTTAVGVQLAEPGSLIVMGGRFALLSKVTTGKKQKEMGGIMGIWR